MRLLALIAILAIFANITYTAELPDDAAEEIAKWKQAVAEEQTKFDAEVSELQAELEEDKAELWDRLIGRLERDIRRLERRDPEGAQLVRDWILTGGDAPSAGEGRVVKIEEGNWKNDCLDLNGPATVIDFDPSIRAFADNGNGGVTEIVEDGIDYRERSGEYLRNGDMPLLGLRARRASFIVLLSSNMWDSGYALDITFEVNGKTHVLDRWDEGEVVTIPVPEGTINSFSWEVGPTYKRVTVDGVFVVK